MDKILIVSSFQLLEALKSRMTKINYKIASILINLWH